LSVHRATLADEERRGVVLTAREVGVEALAHVLAQRHLAVASVLGHVGPDTDRASTLADLEVAALEADQLADAEAGLEEGEDDGLVAERALELDLPEPCAGFPRP
jgi:hypothetical protein